MTTAGSPKSRGPGGPPNLMLIAVLAVLCFVVVLPGAFAEINPINGSWLQLSIDTTTGVVSQIGWDKTGTGGSYTDLLADNSAFWSIGLAGTAGANYSAATNIAGGTDQFGLAYGGQTISGGVYTMTWTGGYDNTTAGGTQVANIMRTITFDPTNAYYNDVVSITNGADKIALPYAYYADGFEVLNASAFKVIDPNADGGGTSAATPGWPWVSISDTGVPYAGTSMDPKDIYSGTGFDLTNGPITALGYQQTTLSGAGSGDARTMNTMVDVPEPGSLALLPMALCGLAFWRRSRRAAA